MVKGAKKGVKETEEQREGRIYRARYNFYKKNIN